MNKIIGIVVSVAALGTFIGLGEVSAQRDEIPDGYPQSIEPDVVDHLGLAADFADHFDDIGDLAVAVFDLADDLLTDKGKRQSA